MKAHLASPHIISFSPVRDHPSNPQAREFLYSEYQGHCQITGNTFPKASTNAESVAENYFETCALLSYADASYLNNEGNMLCVSADTMAKLKNASFEWLDDLETTIEEFNKTGESTEVSVRVLLAGTECMITWSQRHFMRLVALWKKGNRSPPSPARRVGVLRPLAPTGDANHPALKRRATVIQSLRDVRMPRLTSRSD